jgi:hypothetical protein
MNIEEADRMIVDERERQVSHEGYSEKHDDAHVYGALGRAALAYINVATTTENTEPPNYWPWDREYWKPWSKTIPDKVDKQRCLVKAGALLLAEQARVMRLLAKVREEVSKCS